MHPEKWSFEQMAKISEEYLRELGEATYFSPDASAAVPISEEIAEMIKATNGILNPRRLIEREKATGTGWVSQLKDVADTLHDLAKDIREAYLVEKRAARGDGDPNPEDPSVWLSSFKDRLDGGIGQLSGVLMAFKKFSQGAEIEPIAEPGTKVLSVPEEEPPLEVPSKESPEQLPPRF